MNTRCDVTSILHIVALGGAGLHWGIHMVGLLVEHPSRLCHNRQLRSTEKLVEKESRQCQTQVIYANGLCCLSLDL